MSAPNDGGPAFPHGRPYDTAHGLTKREYFAAKALQGLLANPNHDGKFSDFAEDAVKHADALLAELAKTEGSK